MADSHSALFAFVSMTHTGHPLVQSDKGLLFHRVASMSPCAVDEATLYKIQLNLLNTWMDKLKTMPNETVDIALGAVPQKLWNPDLARPCQ